MKLLDESKILFFKTNENAMIPRKTKGNIGYDVFCVFDEDFVVIEPYKSIKLNTGIASRIPERFAMVLHERSSVGSKNILLKCGVIDSQYTGTWRIVLFNLNDVPVIIAKSYVSDFELKEKGYKKFIRLSYEHALVQGILQEDYNLDVVEVDEKEFNKYTTERGNRGFGSTDKNNNRN